METARVHAPYKGRTADALNSWNDIGLIAQAPVVQFTATLPTPKRMNTIHGHLRPGSFLFTQTTRA